MIDIGKGGRNCALNPDSRRPRVTLVEREYCITRADLPELGDCSLLRNAVRTVVSDLKSALPVSSRRATLSLASRFTGILLCSIVRIGIFGNDLHDFGADRRCTVDR